MAITYPLSTPADIGLAQINLRAANATAVAESPFTYAQQVHAHAGQRWEASVNVTPALRQYSEAWVAFLLSLKGRVGTFYLGDPAGATPRGAAKDYSDTLTLGTQTVVGNDQIVISGATTATGYFLPGDYIQVGNQLFKVLTSADSSASSVTVDVWPNVRSVQSVGTSVVFTNAKGLFRLASGVSEWSISNANTYGIAFEAIEVI
jgi:hypothetical protein